MAGGEPSVRILVVQKDPDKSLGRIADALGGDSATLDVRMANDDLPDVADYDGLVVLPGLANPDDDDPAVHRARRTVEEAVDRAVPVLGICLGGQLVAQVLGGETYRCRDELGYHEVETTEAVCEDPLLRDAAPRFMTFHAHTYAFRPPPGAVVLLSNDVCVQACQLGEAWAFHVPPGDDRGVGRRAGARRPWPDGPHRPAHGHVLPGRRHRPRRLGGGRAARGRERAPARARRGERLRRPVPGGRQVPQYDAGCVGTSSVGFALTKPSGSSRNPIRNTGIIAVAEGRRLCGGRA